MIYVMAVAIGVIAGLRTMTAPAAVSWAAWLGWLELQETSLAFLGSVWAVGILTLLALGELVADQLPSTPSRKVPIQFGARIVAGALCGAAIAAPYDMLAGGALSGMIGAVIGTYVGCRRPRLARQEPRPRPARGPRRGFRGDRRRLPDRQQSVSGRSFDAIVIGGGQAGPPLAGRLTGAGMKVALVERHLLGGTCVNTGCRPTKTLVASAYAVHLARRGAEFGFSTGEIRIDFAGGEGARRRRRRGGARRPRRLAGGNGRTCTLLHGHARLEGPDRVRVGEDLLTAPRIFLNVGGRALLPDLPGVHDVPSLNNSTMLALDHLPEHLLIVGGSYVGLEFAQIYRRLGARVTVVERNRTADRPRGRGGLRGGARDPRGRGHRDPHPCRVHRADEPCGRRRDRPRLRGRAAGGFGQPCAARRRPPPEHRRSRPRDGRRRDGRTRLHPGRRRPRHQCSRHLGAGRVQRPRRLHPHRL